MRSNVPITRLGKFFGDRDFELEVEMGQEWLGETIVDAQTVPLSVALDQFDDLSPYLSSWSHDQKVAYLNNWQEPQDV